MDDENILKMAEIIKSSLDREQEKRTIRFNRKFKRRYSSKLKKMSQQNIVFPIILSNDISINDGNEKKELEKDFIASGLLCPASNVRI